MEDWKLDDLVVPCVHLNGTSKAALVQALTDSYVALATASEALAASAPNARDYYVLDAGAFERARAQHESRQQRIAEVLAEIVHLSAAVDRQGR